MKILHACLSNYYIDGFSYQENELVAQNIADGHAVRVVASTETFGEHREIVYVAPSTYLGGDGAEVIRLPYRGFLPHFLMRKMRMHLGFAEQLRMFKPDVILFHGACGWEINTAASYKKRNPGIRLYVDSHEDFNNSARNWLSKWGLHFAYYRSVLRHNLKWIDKILCVNVAAMDFLKDFYGIPSLKLEFFPLGGKIPRDAEFLEHRQAARVLHDVQNGDILFVQSGKMDGSKKLVESLAAFARTPDPRFRFVIAGHIHEDIADEANRLMKADGRVKFIGWQTAEQLQALLCAADVYLQPGTQSATMQMSLCSRCAVVLDDVPSHKRYVEGNGWLLNEDTTLDDVLKAISQSPQQLRLMAERSHAFATQHLDYQMLGRRIAPGAIDAH